MVEKVVPEAPPVAGRGLSCAVSLWALGLEVFACCRPQVTSSVAGSAVLALGEAQSAAHGASLPVPPTPPWTAALSVPHC